MENLFVLMGMLVIVALVGENKKFERATTLKKQASNAPRFRYNTLHDKIFV